MKIKKLSLLTMAIGVFSLATNLQAQMDGRINGDPDAFNMLKSRTVLVEVMEENQKLMDELAKDKKNPDGVQHYKDFIAANNTMLKKAVDKYWKFNSIIQYKTTTELKDIIGKSHDYVIISFRSLTGTTFEMNNFDTYSMPLIWYDRSERNGNEEPDDFMYLPVTALSGEPSPECWTYTQSDYDFAIMQLQDNINYMIANNKKMRYLDYAKKISEEKKCNKLQTETLVMDNSMLDEKVDESAIKSFYKGPIELTDGKSDETFENHVQGKEVMFSFGYGIASGSMGVGIISVTQSALYFCKAVVDCSTGELLYFYQPPGGMNSGSATTWQFKYRKYLFYYMQKCK